jgi:uncharacterized membrane protein
LILVGIFSLFAIVYSLISLVNHYMFHTYGLDMGMFNHALYSFAHLKMNYVTTAIDGSSINYFADHFSPLSILFSPFYYLMGTYTLLVIQIAAILLGGLGACLLARRQLDTRYLPLIVLVQFFGIWGIYSALSFGFHNDVMGAMLVPWLVYFYLKDKKGLVVLFFVLILIAKENMALWLIFIMLGLMIIKGLSRWREYLRFEMPLIVAAAVYFSVVMGQIMPALSDGYVTEYYLYGNTGDSTLAIAEKYITDPWRTITLIFNGHAENQSASWSKLGLHAMILASGGVAFLLAPAFWLMLIPIYLQNFLSDDPKLWSQSYQYSIYFVPIISMALIAALAKLRQPRLQYSAAIIVTLATYVFMFAAIESGQIFVVNSNISARFYGAEHYQTSIDRDIIVRLLDYIPDKASVSASPSLVPHLSFRDKIYMYPVIKDADYIVLLQDFKNQFPDLSQFPEREEYFLLESAKPEECCQYWIYRRKPDASMD